MSGAADAVSYFKSEGDRAYIDVDARSRGLLVLSQRFRPGWHAIVNGSAAPIYRVDGDLCGIVLDRGYDRIVLEYRPWPLYLAWVVSAGALFALIFRGRVLCRDLLPGSAHPYAANWKEHYQNASAGLVEGSRVVSGRVLQAIRLAVASLCHSARRSTTRH